MNKKIRQCHTCNKHISTNVSVCEYCGELYLKNANKISKKNRVKLLRSLKYGSRLVIINVMIYSLLMWGIIKLFSAIGDFFHF